MQKKLIKNDTNCIFGLKTSLKSAVFSEIFGAKIKIKQNLIHVNNKWNEENHQIN